MDTTIRNLDEEAYRALQARAVLEGRPVENLISDAIRAYLWRARLAKKSGSLRELQPESYPEGNERLSEEIDFIVYGVSR